MKTSLIMLIFGTCVGIAGIITNSEHLLEVSAIWIVGSLIKQDTERKEK